METEYDRVPYPSAIFEQTHPDRLGMLMRLAGLDPVDPARSRILEVGGGDCLNLLSLATIFPECDAHGFDLAAAPIEQGRKIAQAAGLTNVTLAVEDIMAAHQRYPARSFDYVIVHGVYAWVPPAVRAAIMPLLAHVLTDCGVAMVSFNAMPGGHLRMVMHEMLMQRFAAISDPAQRLAEARAFLTDYAEAREADTPFHTALRDQAQQMVRKPASVLFHDELGEQFHPQRLRDAVHEAQASGLRFLSDAGRNRHLDGMLDDGAPLPPDPDAAVLDAAMIDDYAALRYFRHPLFVRAESKIDRRIDTDRIAGMWLSTRLERLENGDFKQGDDVIAIPDAALAGALERAAAVHPQRVPLAEVASTPVQRRILLQLFAEWYVNLHPGPAPFVAKPGLRPETSKLARALIARDNRTVCSLAHRVMLVDQPEMRALIAATDGTRTLADIAQLVPDLPADQIEPALGAMCSLGLLRA